LGTGYHGGFGDTKGYKTRKRIFTPVQYEGTVKVNGVERDVSRRVYQRDDINFNYVDDDTGETNLQRMLKGNAPYGKDGKPLELHHILQKEVGPMVEIHETTHQEYKQILHGLKGSGDSFRNDKSLDSQYRNFKRAYWKWRAQQYLGGKGK
jgi:hypothetical protein